MLLREMILEKHSKAQCDRIVAHIGTDKKRFSGLMELVFSGEPVVSQRAAWPMSYCVQQYPALIIPYIGRLIRYMGRPGIHDAIARNTLRLLQYVEVPKRYHGGLMTTCFSLIESPEAAVAIKAFALTVLENLAHHYPEIFSEIELVIEERFEQESAAFRSRARKLLDKRLPGNRRS